MRVRPFFWLFLVFVCTGILVYAATVQMLVPASLHVQLVQHPSTETPTTLKVQVTDSQGLTVDGAQISSRASMTNMQMATDATSTTGEGQGTYLVQIPLYMAGPWIITVKMQANGFLPLRQTLLVQVQSTPASAYLFAQPLSGNGSERASAFTSLPSLCGFPQ
jgi:YtkA-like